MCEIVMLAVLFVTVLASFFVSVHVFIETGKDLYDSPDSLD